MIRPSVMLMSGNGPDGKPWDWRAKLAQWKATGLEGVDVFQVMLKATGETPESILKVLKEIGLKPTCFCIPTNLVSESSEDRAASMAMIEYGIEACKTLGVKHLFSHGGQHTNSGEAAFLSYKDGLIQACQKANEAGLLFSIENAGKMCNTGDSLARMLELVNQPNFRITFDGGNFITCGDEPHTAILKLREKVAHVHVKSHVPAPAGSPRPYKYCPTGFGHPDYGFIREKLIEVGYDSWMSFETEGGPDADYDLSVANLVKLLKSKN